MASAFLEFKVQGFPQVSSGQLAPDLLPREPGMESPGPAKSPGCSPVPDNYACCCPSGSGLGGKDGSG